MTLEFPQLGEKIAAAIQSSVGAQCMANPSHTALHALGRIEAVLTPEQFDELRARPHWRHGLKYSDASRSWTYFGVRVETRSTPLNGYLRARQPEAQA